MTDIEINKKCNLKDINLIAKKLNINENDIQLYGKYKAKLDLNISNNKNGKLILVTSINPTPYGEGKTTISIGINDALRKLNKNSIVVLREPSLGPIFGIKGGATGGGHSQVAPMEDINLHFTGDIHAVELANNLLCAVIDNHIYQGNKLNIKDIVFNRCMDLNDRALRNITINSKYNRNDSFKISVASEIMAILCLATSFSNLRHRLENILIGYSYDNKMIFAKELNVVDSLLILLKDAIKPNLVQTLENNPAIIHGGPFANIAHGCNSIIATNMALKLCDYVVTEAGFGADLGAEKFFDIKCMTSNLKPNCVVINATIRAIKYNGNDIKDGIKNLDRHIENIKKFTNNVIVVLNKYDTDSDSDIEYVKNHIDSFNIKFSIINSYKDGGKGAIEAAETIIDICNNKIDFKNLYNYNDSIINKINTICNQIYRASSVIINEEVMKKINMLAKNGYENLPICIAKTQYSFTDDPKILGAPINFDMKVTDIELCSGAGFIVVYMGNIMSMPGLGKESSYLHMKIDDDFNISGLF